MQQLGWAVEKIGDVASEGPSVHRRARAPLSEHGFVLASCGSPRVRKSEASGVQDEVDKGAIDSPLSLDHGLVRR